MGSLPTQQTIRVLIAGGAYAGVSAAVNLLDLSLGRPARLEPDKVPAEEARNGVPIEIYIVDERDGYYHTIGSPLALSSPDYATKAWRNYNDIAALQHPNIHIKQGTLANIDPDRRVGQIHLSNGEIFDQPYDFFIAATGLRRVWPVVPQSLTKDEYLAEAADHIQSVSAASHGTVVIGGGAVGIEMAAETKLCHPHTKVTLVHSRDKLLSSEPLPDETKDAAHQALLDADVEVLLSERVIGTTASIGTDGKALQTLTLQNGPHLIASQVIRAISQSVPNTSYLPKSALDSDGLVKIDPYLTFLPSSHPHAPHHLAIGDLIAWPGIKRCGAAIAMGTRAASNIFQQILFETYGIPRTLRPWPKYPSMIGLAVGRKAVVYDPEGGTRCSEEMMGVYFGGDLAFQQCWDYQKLDEGW